MGPDLLRPAYCFVRPFSRFDRMEIVNLVVEAALATGLVGYLVNRAWRWWRRPRLRICYDPDVDPEAFLHRGFSIDEPDKVATFYEHIALVHNDGHRSARGVEAVLEYVARWGGETWEERRGGPWNLVWSGTRQTTANIPGGGGSRRLSVFMAGPSSASYVYASTPFNLNANALSIRGHIDLGRTLICLRVAGLDGSSDSCTLELTHRGESSNSLEVEGDCVSPAG